MSHNFDALVLFDGLPARREAGTLARAMTRKGLAVFAIRPAQCGGVLLAAIASAALLGCVHQGIVDEKSAVVSTPLAANSEQVVVQRAGVSDATRLRQLMLLKIAQDCLRLGYVTFAFTSVGVPKPHLPNKPPDAPPEFASTQTFNPPTSHVPQIEPGTMVGVKFFKAGDPGAADSLYAEMIVASLGPTLQR